MLYPETLDRADHHAEAALADMERRQIPPDPVSFSVWYGYHAKNISGLTHEIDELIKHGAEFTYERTQALYAKYFGFDESSSAIQSTSSEIESTVQAVLERIQSADAATASYDQRLSEASGDLGKATTRERVQSVVHKVLVETQGILQKSKALERQLNHATVEIAGLQQDLDKVAREAVTDPLTGLANRKHLDMRLREESKQALTNRYDLCLLLADIDHFKRFNDTYGHSIGDQVLTIVARVLRDELKGRDLAARYGGEEFAVILPKTPLEQASMLADRLRGILEHKELKGRENGTGYGQITLSVGVALYRFGEPLERLIHRADEALYQAKAEGRNRVVSEIDLTSLSN